MTSLSKSTIRLGVESDEFRFHCELKRRITVFRGDSGTGKSSLIEYLSSEDDMVDKICDLQIVPVPNAALAINVLESSRNAVVLFDDLRITESSNFVKMCSECLVKNNLYVVLINREFSNFDSNRENTKYAKISISVTEIYDFKNDGGVNHWLEPIKLPTTEDYSDVDCILVEDKGYGFKFFDNYLSNVTKSSDGKSSLLKDTLQNAQRSSKVLVMIDLAGFGCHWDQFEKIVLRKYKNVFILPYSECFEQMLVYSNALNQNEIVKKELKDLHYYANNFNSWESYFEDLVKRATQYLNTEKFTCWKCNHDARHNGLSKCYLRGCGECSGWEYETCTFKEKSLAKDKFEYLFTDTLFQCLLELPRKPIGHGSSTSSLDAF